MDRKQILMDIFNDDPFGLLILKPKTNHRNTDERLVAAFQKVVEFYEENSREPELVKDVHESQLYYELKALRQHNEKKTALKEYDVYDLLDTPTVEKEKEQFKEYKTVTDIITDDPLGILNTDDSIFTLTHVSKESDKERSKTDFMARRKPCKDFANFESIFKICHANLKNDERRFVPFKEEHIRQGAFFVVDGMLAYVDKADTVKRDKHKRNKKDGRIRCIFENGTESNLYFRSLGKALYKNGQSVSELINNTDLIINHISQEDKESGFIYILKSKSANPEIQAIPNLYKIGFSTTAVEERIKNAFQDPTYLMADVKIVTTYKCYNLTTQVFEKIIHTFFGSVSLVIDIFDNKRVRHSPREWFTVPLAIIEQAIPLIISGDIVRYHYDNEREIIERLGN